MLAVTISIGKVTLTGELLPIESAPVSSTGKSKIVFSYRGFQKITAQTGPEFDYSFTVVRVIPKSERGKR